MKIKVSFQKIGVVLLTGLTLFFIGKHFYKKSNISSHNVIDYAEWDLSAQTKCPGPIKSFVMNDVYLRGVIEKDQKVDVIQNNYACEKPQRGDIVMIKGRGANPTIKIIQAIPGDTYELTKDSKHNAWNIQINGKKLIAKDGRDYFFGTIDAAPTLYLYQQDRGGKGILRSNEILVFSSFPPGDRDSGIFGIYTAESLVGKVVTDNLSESSAPSEAPLAEIKNKKSN